MSDTTGTQTVENAMGTVSETVTVTADETDSHTQQETVQLKLTKPQADRKVKWSNETVDNEHMDKKKSKCCCIYKKPLAFGESSSDDSSGDENCDHHSHRKKKSQKKSDEGDHECKDGIEDNVKT